MAEKRHSMRRHGLWALDQYLRVDGVISTLRKLWMWGSVPLTAILSPLIPRLFVPMSWTDTILVSLMCGLVAAALCYFFAPRERHIHHLPL